MRRSRDEDEDLDVRRAAALIGRHPETVRRWVWSGRLAARRSGRRLLVSRMDLEALAGQARTSLREWAGAANVFRAKWHDGSTGSAADLVIEDRARRSGAAEPDAGH